MSEQAASNGDGDRLDLVVLALEGLAPNLAALYESVGELTEDVRITEGSVRRLVEVQAAQSQDIARFFDEFSNHLRDGHS